MDYWDCPPKLSQFPVSNARDTPWSIDQFTQASRNRRERCSLQPVSPRRIIELPKIHQISGGFLHEDGLLIYTAEHSSVLRCLEYAKAHWRLPTNVPDKILALAALETFLHPFNPAHWLFWSNEQKDQSAKLVQSHICRRTPTIYHPLSWSILDWKFRLSGIHSKQLPDVLCREPWYDTLVLSTYLKDLPIRGPVLRKRKAHQTKISERTKDADSLPVKKSRITRARPTRTAASPMNTLLEPETLLLDMPNPDSSLNPARITSVLPDAYNLSQLPRQHANPSASSGCSNDNSSRQSPKILSARLPKRASTSSTSSSPTYSSIVLPPPEYSRTRSSSRLSARTLVDDTRDLSPSVSSATTVADSSSAKGRQKADVAPVESEARLIGVIDVKDIASLAETFNDKADFYPRVTRSRTGASKTEVAISGPQRSLLGRKNRMNNVHPYSTEKAARGLAHCNSGAAEKLIDSDTLVPSPAPRSRSRKAKISRR
ncbi:hypothetical protein F5876DRAFT_76242 [Lentinula aff. lateritia]|uniref:Uncharacterized protein n=1 Tax=Lentinula aff. lateritia TaxID=2804960 RepID=A0ACC1U234_9AGAR|nr:hypothetical protein F5876DRAFT_76242 [Lentinula aff. lateritia]